MSSSSMGLSDSVLKYLRTLGIREDADQLALREATAEHPDSSKMSMMQISPEQGQFMTLLVELIGAKRCLEIGVFTGYSALTVAKAMGPEGHVVALDVSEKFTAIAREHWDKAGVADQIDLRLAPATESLAAMLAAGEHNSFDFAFIDADKGNYLAYYNAALDLVRPGGVIGIDNVLWGGSVADPMDHRPDTEAIRGINEALLMDKRVTISMVPIGDGLTL
ncbi:MAG: methyltransferase domain-containing protein, partial [Rhodospirillaceae bacterium]|nr:methyltransferase domain-containing protein [Rhodospirillaceae bacterium]